MYHLLNAYFPDIFASMHLGLNIRVFPDQFVNWCLVLCVGQLFLCFLVVSSVGLAVMQLFYGLSSFPLQQLLSFSLTDALSLEQLLSFSSTAALFLLNRCSLSLQQLLSLTTALFLFNSWTFSLQQLLSFSSTAVMVIFLWSSTFLFYSCFLPLKQLYWQHAGDYNDTIKSKLGIYYNYTYIEIWLMKEIKEYLTKEKLC